MDLLPGDRSTSRCPEYCFGTLRWCLVNAILTAPNLTPMTVKRNAIERHTILVYMTEWSSFTPRAKWVLPSPSDNQDMHIKTTGNPHKEAGASPSPKRSQAGQRRPRSETIPEIAQIIETKGTFWALTLKVVLGLTGALRDAETPCEVLVCCRLYTMLWLM